MCSLRRLGWAMTLSLMSLNLTGCATLERVGDSIWGALEPLLPLDGATLKARRREKFLEMGRSAVV